MVLENFILSVDMVKYLEKYWTLLKVYVIFNHEIKSFIEEADIAISTRFLFLETSFLIEAVCSEMILVWADDLRSLEM